jgi:hypothetical protein
MGWTCVRMKYGFCVTEHFESSVRIKGAWTGESVQIRSDNVGAVFTMDCGCMRKECLHAPSLGIWKVAWQRDISICAQSIRGDNMLAAGADGFAGDSDYGECRLRPSVLARLWETCRMEEDLLCSSSATQYNPQISEQLLAV